MKENNFTFSWENLTVWYVEKQQRFWSSTHTKKIILAEVSGSVASNSLVAVMGASGVGKTTFLAALAGKNNDKEGVIQFNNKTIEDEYVKSISSYIYQTDIVMESLTVSEHLKFVSALKLHKKREERDEIIRDILYQLNLETCVKTRLKFLSGGEKKRVALAAELLNDPHILFCDEPTSGLDSYSAITIIQKLQARAKTGKLVMVTIHQPSSQLFDYFNHIILLSAGKIFHQGSKEDISSYFINFNLECPPSYNPAEFYIKCMSELSQERMKKGHVKNPLFVGNGNMLGEDFSNTYVENGLVDSEYLKKFKNTKRSFWSQMFWLIWRTTIDTKRNFGYHLVQFFLLMITSSILAIFYSLVTADNQNNVQDIKGILFFFTSELIFTQTYAFINTFPEGNPLFLREKPLYSTHSYFISKVVAIVPRNLIQPFSFLAINFVVLNFLSGFENFIKMFGVLSIACMAGSMIGICISAIFSSIEYMDLFLAPYEVMTMLAAGILLNMRTLVYFSWIKYLSPFYYTYESLSILYWTKVDDIVCKNESVACYNNGKHVLEELGFYTDDIYVLLDVIQMLLLTLVTGFVGFATIFYKRNKFTSY